MEMTVKEVLIAARAKIADPANWTQGEFAKDREGTWVAYDSSEATCWCAIGAILSSSGCKTARKTAAILTNSIGMPIHEFNDIHTHAEVLAKFDEAIAAQGGE